MVFNAAAIPLLASFRKSRSPEVAVCRSAKISGVESFEQSSTTMISHGCQDCAEAERTARSIVVAALYAVIPMVTDWVIQSRRERALTNYRIGALAHKRPCFGLHSQPVDRAP